MFGYSLLYNIRKGGDNMSSNLQRAEVALNKYGDSLMYLAYSYTKNMHDAQDMVQDAFLRFMTKAPEFETDEHEKAWLIRVTINLCKNLLTSTYKKTYSELDENISVTDEYSSGLTEIVNFLPEKYRTVIHLFYYEGYSQKEIAKILDILLPSGHISAFITVIFSFVTTVFIICIIGNLLGKYAPRIKKWIAGR